MAEIYCGFNVNKLLQEEMITPVGGGIRWQVTVDKKLHLLHKLDPTESKRLAKSRAPS